MWRLAPAPDSGLVLTDEAAGLRFDLEEQAWEAAEQLFTGQGADGPFGVAALVGPVFEPDRVEP